MTVIDNRRALAALCRRLSKASYVTVDTEFMGEKSYWPKLCLVQLAAADEAACVDPLAPGMELEPLFELLADPGTLKVFHSARQDIEIFYNLAGRVPAPLFDTQVAAMVCGFGEAAGYETLAANLASARIDKGVRFTDWSRRPLSARQIAYALADVTHLRPIYEKLAWRLDESGRRDWLDEEMAALTNPATYATHPEEAWRRLKPRAANPRLLGVLREIAAWREVEAQRRDVPRPRVLRDEALLAVAAQTPRTAAELAHVRGLPHGWAKSETGAAVLEAVARGLALPEEALPRIERAKPAPGTRPLVGLLKVLLKLKCERHHVAARLVASSADLERIAVDDQAPVPALRGWRREIFGADALALKHGKLALAADGKKATLVTLAAGVAAGPAPVKSKPPSPTRG